MPVHPAAATGFARSAEAYERGRPGYPEDAVRWLVDRLRLTRGRTVVDLAAGTGKLTRALAESGADVVAVEPVAEMRAAITVSGRVLDGSAEAIPLPAAATDAVTVAQAFHWFDGDAALAEIHRVLRPGGALGLIWNRRPLEDPIHAAIEALFAPYRGETPAHRSGAWRGVFGRTSLFGPLEQHDFTNSQLLDGDGLVDRVGSTSFVAALERREREELLNDVRALAAGGPIRLPYATEVFAADRLD